MQIDNSALDSRYAVVAGSPIHSPFYEGNARENDVAFKIQKTKNEALALVKEEQPESCLNQTFIHFSISVPYHPSILYIEYCELPINVRTEWWGDG